MAKIGMSIHSKSAFDESESIRLLSGVLESNRKIKTFFGENDKTPNTDGYFELIGDDDEIKKQFIVQIKKVENLSKETKGKNINKYVYDLQTEFLYYVKEKVTESPAIYFVVDIGTKNIFWLYLSDNLLMELDFEGHQRKQYAFCDNDILKDIISFEKTLHDIANERNKKFVNRTEEQIAEIQEAVEYINNLFNGDFNFIKDKIFPNLWRFGVANSYTNSFKMTIFNPTDNTTHEVPESTANIFALYPQIKGKPDYGFKEVDATSKYFNHIDTTGTTSPMKYVQDVTKTMVEDYFNNHLCLDIMPDIALKEIVCSFIEKAEQVLTLKITDENNSVPLSDIMSTFAICMEYIAFVVDSRNNLSDAEKNMSDVIIRNIKANRIYRDGIDILNYINMFSCNKEFIEFYNSKKGIQKFHSNIFSVVSKIYNVYYLAIKELEQRRVKTINYVWIYDNIDLDRHNEEEQLSFYNDICSKWFTQLQDEYQKLYEKLFHSYIYMNSGNFRYKLDKLTQFGTIDWGYAKYNTNNNVISIDESPLDICIFFDWKQNENIRSVSMGHDLYTFLDNKMLIYDSLRCLLYQGICKGLQLKSNGLLIHGRRISIFD